MSPLDRRSSTDQSRSLFVSLPCQRSAPTSRSSSSRGSIHPRASRCQICSLLARAAFGSRASYASPLGRSRMWTGMPSRPMRTATTCHAEARCTPSMLVLLAVLGPGRSATFIRGASQPPRRRPTGSTQCPHPPYAGGMGRSSTSTSRARPSSAGLRSRRWHHTLPTRRTRHSCANGSPCGRRSRRRRCPLSTLPPFVPPTRRHVQRSPPSSSTLSSAVRAADELSRRPRQPLPRLTSGAFACVWPVGFVTLVNHGLPHHLMDRAWADAATFFALPADAKAKCAFGSAEANRGYLGVGEERADFRVRRVLDSATWKPLLDRASPRLWSRLCFRRADGSRSIKTACRRCPTCARRSTLATSTTPLPTLVRPSPPAQSTADERLPALLCTK